MEAFTTFCHQFRVDKETGEHRFAVLQAEDELSAAGIVIGAGWAGARSFTNTSGPGISLMQEFIGLAYYTDIPAVFIDVQRCGPATGMPTRTQQADLISLAYASHGDTKHLVLFPADPKECFEMTVQAFDLAERFQTPVFVLTDLDIGMNDWMVPKLTWDDAYRPDRGKVLDAEALEGVKTFHRYLDSDGDGIPYRTLPGVHPRGAYFARGSGHNRYGGYTEDDVEYTDVVDRIARKIQNAAKAVPAPVIRRTPGATMGILTVGGCHAACVEAMDLLGREGVALDYLRVRGFPFGDEVRQFLESHEVNFIVEQNRDAQLRSLLTLDTAVPLDRLHSVRYYGGFPMSAHHVVTGIRAKVGKAA
jgi:2-oxoglutarate/2-oxoacid ferredoxin oxidoreductase subunit alpha